MVAATISLVQTIKTNYIAASLGGDLPLQFPLLYSALATSHRNKIANSMFLYCDLNVRVILWKDKQPYSYNDDTKCAFFKLN